MDKKELLGLRNFGDKSFDELHEALLTRDLIPPGTPLDLSAREEDEDAIVGELDTGEIIDYPEYDQAVEPDAFMAQSGETADHDVPDAQIVDAAGVSEGSMEAAAGIYIDDEPASEDVDVLPDDHETDLGQAEAAPKARSRKKS
jgi:hypothetical protein